MSPELTDEICALNSIYGDDCLTPLAPSNLLEAALFLLHPPDLSQSITIKLSIPESYPRHAPNILSLSIEGRKKGANANTDAEIQELSDVCRGLLASVHDANGGDQVCLFEFIEGLKDILPPHTEPTPPAIPVNQQECEDISQQNQQIPQRPWVLSDPVIEKKSVFVGRAIRVENPDEAKLWVEELVSGDKKLTKATHNIFAYRIKRPNDNSIIFQDNDDDGETAAGSRLSHLLSIMDVTNVLVVVSRWYGGVKLGGDRFRIINMVARQAIVRLLGPEEEGSTGKEVAKDRSSGTAAGKKEKGGKKAR